MSFELVVNQVGTGRSVGALPQCCSWDLCSAADDDPLQALLGSGTFCRSSLAEEEERVRLL